jgi:hypothetical protein
MIPGPGPGPGDARARGDAGARARTAATAAAKSLGAKSVRGLLLGSVAWFGFLTIAGLIFGHPATWTTYLEWAGGYVAGCVIYRSGKRALAARTAARRSSPPN